jgi:hypothetical protein
MKYKNVRNSPRLLGLKRRRRKIILKKIFIFLFGLIAVVGFLSYLSHLNKLNISDVEISGNSAMDSKIIKTEVQKRMAGNYLWIFPKTNIFFYPQSYIKNDLLNKFKRLEDVKLSIKDRKILEVSVVERIPKYIWCGTSVSGLSTDKAKCYFIDDNGYIFDEAPYFSGEVYFKFYGKIAGEKDNPTGSFFAKENFLKLISFKETLETLNLKPVAVYIMSDGNVKVYLSNGSSSPTGPQIIFKLNSDFQKISENLGTALTTEPLQTDFKKKYSSLLYIDLRFGNKVYYKFK